MNEKKVKLIKTFSIIFLILIILCIIYAFSKINILNNINSKINKETENELPLFSYQIYDNQDEQNIKVLITVNSKDGIEYIKKPDGNIINGYGKAQIKLDYLVNKDTNYKFEIKESNQTPKENNVLIDHNLISETAISIKKISENEGYKTIKITNNINMDGYKTYYKIGKNSSEWVEGTGKIPILDFDILSNGLINDDNKTVTILAKVENSSTADSVLISEDYDIDTSATTASFVADSLIAAIEKFDFGTGKFKVTVSDETYNLRVYSFEEDLKIDTNMQFGTEDDVGAANKYAENMIVLKVNGNVTIYPNVTLTSYSSKTGHGGPKGMMIYTKGTLTNNGIISMTARGAYAQGQNVYLWNNENGSYEFVPAEGAKGGIGSSGTDGVNGINGVNRQTGGGGSGMARKKPNGNGSNGTSYSGGTGGAGSVNLDGAGDFIGNAGSAFGGPGGVNSRSNDFNGVGNPIGGTGGLLILYAQSINNNGQILSNGVGAEEANIKLSSSATAGGSSGGGSINVFYRNQFSNTGILKVNGGKAASVRYGGGFTPYKYWYAGAGGNGSISIGNISTGTYISD